MNTNVSGAPPAPVEHPSSLLPDTAPPTDFLRQLSSLRRPIVLGHVSPDADSLGSALGLATTLRANGIDAHVGLPGASVAARLQFMLELAAGTPLVNELPASSQFDALVIVDTASEKRINIQPAPDLANGRPSFNIDHHITNTDFAQHNWVDPRAASTSEMVSRLIRAQGWTPSPQTASLLYAGIHGDTAGFSLPNTTAECLHIAAELVRAGADVSHLGEQLCRSQGRQDFELLRRVYDHTTVIDEGRIAYSYLTHQDIVEAGCKADDIDDQVSIPRALRGVQLALLFSEGEPGVVRINLRGEGRVTVVELAQKFGGGGHSQSAGVRMRNRPMKEVIDLVVAAAREHLRSLDI